MESSATRDENGEHARTPRGNVPRDRRVDPLALLTSEFDGVHDVWRSAAGTVCVAGPETARAVMGNRHAAVAETSDFYRTRHGVFGPRAAQIRIGRSARALMRRHLDARRAELPGLVAEHLAPSSVWPDAGNLLVFRHLRDALLHPEAPAQLHATVEEIVNRSVLAGARRRHSPPSRLLFRRRALSTLHAEIRARQRDQRQCAGPAEPRDLLDVVLDGNGDGTGDGSGETNGGGDLADPSELAEVYLSFLFASVGSIGFALGWSLHLLGTHPGTPAAEPGWTVREALRLWPVAWLFARTPSRVQDLGGTTVTPRDQLAVCTYLVHRHPGHWERPDEFVPQRWAAAAPDAAYLPFGLGPHTCAGATVTMRLLEDLIGLITRDWHLSVTSDGGGPHVGPALAPPRFTAVLSFRDGCPGGG
ncbi:cytochrome P450 [Streptomyces beijiangensis]|uniref:Cytochrome P450 n=1 Tax=Streptomyces beijiangensis TaxID=163361 RepID=A0A939JH56_9ACTN|nr:cytochrome P450 [Streptomyces beijiangensis]MBO0511189.1 cytochrome P450 [Streptomyces beijiangensis]